MSDCQELLCDEIIDISDFIKNEATEEKNRVCPGVYNYEERFEKILKYKNKIIKWRKAHPVCKRYNGRSKVAGMKFRVRGKFVTPDKYLIFVKEQKQLVQSE